MNQIAPLQPELRALMMFDRLPEGCIAHLVTDTCAVPHIRPGEFVVVDTKDCEVRHLETYVIEWHGGRRSVCEAVAREFNWSDPCIPRDGWQVRSITGLRGKALMDAISRAIADPAVTMLNFAGWTEGPYRSDDGYLESKLVGTVIGIFNPQFEEPRRVAS